MNKTPFSEQLSTLRQDAQLTNQELADDARVPASLIAGLQSGKRRIGEYQARKIGVALGLCGGDLERFIYDAINNCSEKVLEESKGYPAELLNLLARQLRLAGVLPNNVTGWNVQKNAADLVLSNGGKAHLETVLTLT